MTDDDGILILLNRLSTQSLRRLASNNEIEVDDRRVRASLQRALAGYYTTIAAVLDDLDRQALIALCEEFDLAETGQSAYLRGRLNTFLAELNVEGDTDPAQPSSSTIVPALSTHESSPWGSPELSGRDDPARFNEDFSRVRSAVDARAEDSGQTSHWWFVLGVGVAIMAVGRFVNELDYLYPTRGNVLASARRRNNPLAIAFKGIATVLGLFIGILMLLGLLLSSLAGGVR